MSIFGNFGGSSGNTGGSVFGAQNTNQGAAGTSVFGSTNTASNPQQSTSAFGATNANPAPAATGSIFGTFGATASNTTNQPAAGTSLFGNNANATNNTAGTSLFGNNAANTNTNTNTGTTGLFGGNTGSNNLFGNGPAIVQAGLNNPLFGGPGNATANAGTSTTGATGGGGLFGGGNTTNTGGGLFGSNTNTQQGNTTGTGLFGSNTQQQNATGTTGTGLFGNTQTTGTNIFGAAKPATGGLFGSTTTPNTNTNTNTTSLFSGGSLFGGQQQQQNQQQQPQQQSSLFGGQQQQQQPQQQSSLFGSSTLFGGNKSTLGTSALGAPAQQNNFASSALNNPTNAQEAAQQYNSLIQKFERVYAAWNPDSSDCEFQYSFYNLVDPKQVNLYGRPANAKNDALWAQAVRENPDPSCLVPVIAIGFDDLRTRVDAQTAQSAFHLQNLNDLQSRLAALRTQHAVSNASRLLRAASVQTQVIQRLMRFIQHLHFLLPTIRSSALRPEEEALRGKLEELEEEMRRGRVKGRLNELWALIGSVSASVERSAASAGSGGEWAVVDEEGLAQIAQILSEQQAGLQHLTKILQKDQRDLNIILGIDTKSANESSGEDGGGVGETLWGSISTLRASSLR